MPLCLQIEGSAKFGNFKKAGTSVLGQPISSATRKFPVQLYVCILFLSRMFILYYLFVPCSSCIPSQNDI